MPIVVVIAPGPISPFDGDSITMLMLLILAAGVGCFLLRRR
jgi:hypothetical protein